MLPSTPKEIDELEEQYAQTARSKYLSYVPKNLLARIGDQEKIIFCYYSGELHGVLVYILTDRKVMVSEFQSPKLQDFVEISLTDVEDVFIKNQTDETRDFTNWEFRPYASICIKKKGQVVGSLSFPRGSIFDIEHMRVQILQAKENLDTSAFAEPTPTTNPS